MEQLAIRLSEQNTLAKSLVIRGKLRGIDTAVPFSR